MASAGRELHADWLGVGRKELCRRVVSRNPSAEGGFALALTTLAVLFDPLGQPSATVARYYSRFFIGRESIFSGSRHLHNGDFVPSESFNEFYSNFTQLFSLSIYDFFFNLITLDTVRNARCKYNRNHRNAGSDK